MSRCRGCCAVLKDRGGGLAQFPVAMARGKHLFPFRTEQLSPSAPMVLGPQGPGRVGRRRFTCQRTRAPPDAWGSSASCRAEPAQPPGPRGLPAAAPVGSSRIRPVCLPASAAACELAAAGVARTSGVMQCCGRASTAPPRRRARRARSGVRCGWYARASTSSCGVLEHGSRQQGGTGEVERASGGAGRVG